MPGSRPSRRHNSPQLRLGFSRMGPQTLYPRNGEGRVMESDELRIWLNHFEYHAQHPHCVPSGLTDHLTPAERSLIARSIATFQLGEQSEGATLLAAAERFARVRGTPALARIVELFIAEEQRHAALLREFMQDHGIALKQGDWTDAVFRRVRRIAGLELYLHV